MRDVKFSDLCQFTEKQWEASATADEHRYTLFGGSRGPGKSYWLRWWLLRFVLQQAAQGQPGVNVMLACEDYPSLTGRQISKIATEFPMSVGKLGSTHAKGLGYHLKPEFGGGSILLRNLDDPERYQSFEFAAIGIDELTKNPERTFDILRGSLRWPGLADTRFVAATNPDANWVRDYWIEKRFPDALQPSADEFAFVPALPQDNPHLAQSYWDELGTLSGALRDAWLHGDWYAAVEGLVYGTFIDMAGNEVESFSDENITEQEPSQERPVELAIDDGYVDPRATLFIQRMENGDVLVFDELYQTRTLEENTVRGIFVTLGQPIPERLKTPEESEIGDLEDLYGVSARHKLPVPELAAVSHEATALRRRLRDADIPARNWMSTRAGGGGSTRLAAITLTRGLFCDGQGHRTIKIHKRCKNLLDEIRAGYKYPEGRHGLGTKPMDGNDHAIQALESWVWLRMRRE